MFLSLIKNYTVQICVTFGIILLVGSYFYVKNTSYKKGYEVCQKLYQEQITSNNNKYSNILNNVLTDQNSKSDQQIIQENMAKWSK